MSDQFPVWFHALAIASLAVAAACALWITFDLLRRPEKMVVMNWVWPLATMFGSVLWLALYRKSRAQASGGGETPMPLAVAKGASHCGAGCTLGDIIAEWVGLAFPVLAVWFGWHTIFAEKTFAMWIPDFILAFAIGIVFQYFSIAPMRGLGLREGLAAAIKADTLSISSWQVGMYGGMALIQFGLLKPLYGKVAPVNSPEFWFVMQIAMLAGFATAYPVNWWLVRTGVKEKM
ncbi:DUF4396 domain-containing protein [Novosphingobium sp. ZN18A2]|uniref:DUF4396 domain-containing protein n=1 Tax=Novosphingobium sp. ZN18A2 TaxID=3079861 RepID=UPI0030D0B489